VPNPRGYNRFVPSLLSLAVSPEITDAAYGDETLWRFGNGDDEWTDLTTPLPDTPTYSRTAGSIWASPVSDTLYAVANDKTLWRLDLGQRAWIYVTDMPHRFRKPSPEEG
jgi:hypothetical protein